VKPTILKRLQAEVARQCQFAILAFQDLEQAIQSETLSIERVWFSVQALLIAAANVSKTLYSPPKQNNKGFAGINDNGSKKKELAEIKKALRENLGVAENSILISKEVTGIRNAFEHFDERLYSWATLSKRHNIVDSCIGDISIFEGIDPNDYLRNLNPNTWELTFQGKVYNLKTIIEAIHDLHTVAKTQA
jgi:hypothetical protein